MIPRRKILTYLAISFVFLCMVNFLSTKSALYYLIWWFDMPMHFIGGAAVLFLLAYVFYDRVISRHKIPVAVLLGGVFILGAGWEIFEYIVLTIISHQPHVNIDMLSDICFDMAGGVAGIFIIKR